MPAVAAEQAFLYLFPDRVESAAGGAVSLHWQPGDQPFSARKPLSLNEAHSSVQTRPNALSADECQSIIALGEKLPRIDARTELGPDQYRVSHITWIEPAEHTHWLFHRLGMLFAEANAHYGYDMVGFVDALQYTSYGPGQHFEWHMDLGPGQTSARKLSMTVQLSAPDAYRGGRLEFINMAIAPEGGALGCATVFPSFLAHRVSPVESGVRRSLVAWAYGHSFR